MKNSISNDSIIFWTVSKNFLYHHLPDLRKASSNTINAYRDSLNKYIDYLVEERNTTAKNISFSMFSKENLTSYLDCMLNCHKYAERTCNLRLTAIHSLLEYAAAEYGTEIMQIYVESKNVKAIKVPTKPIEYFESKQMKALC